MTTPLNLDSGVPKTPHMLPRYEIGAYDTKQWQVTGSIPVSGLASTFASIFSGR